MTTPHRSPEEQAALKEFFAAITIADKEGKAAAAAGRDALPRLARAAYGHDNSQATIITRCLASCYNGSEALEVRLDDIRGLDWSLQKDLVAVILGCGKEGFSDKEIRHAFVEAAGSEAGADWLHWWTTGGAHRDALNRLVEFIRGHSAASSGRGLRALLASIVQGEPADLSRLNYMDDELTKDFLLVLSALFGRDQGMLYIEDVKGALERLEPAGRQA